MIQSLDHFYTAHCHRISELRLAFAPHDLHDPDLTHGSKIHHNVLCLAYVALTRISKPPVYMDILRAPKTESS